MNTVLRHLTGIALLVSSALAGAANVELAGQAPYTAAQNGISVYDGGGGPYTQAFSTPGSGTLDLIVWWGYRGQDSTPPGLDAFEVKLNGILQAGVVGSQTDGVLIKYTLDIVDSALAGGPGSLEIFNNESDFEWFWQGTDGTPWPGGNAPFPVAFSLLGTFDQTAIPEPGSLALVALAGLAWLRTRRAR